MLELQKYLSNHSLDDLISEFGMKLCYHPIYPLVIINYDQINSPKMHPIVQECRGLVITTDTFDVVAPCMKRFFNMGEALEVTDKFDWNNKIDSLSKEDGSMMMLFSYCGEWLVKTRGSWAESPICENAPTWKELFFSLLPKVRFRKDKTYIFEMCSMNNQVVRQYNEPTLFLLSIFTRDTYHEWDTDLVDNFAIRNKIKRPEKINIKNSESAKAYIKKLEETDGTAEGLVLRDINGLRLKVKSSTYLSYSQLGGNGNLVCNKNLIPLILANEQDEAIAIFPSIKPKVDELKIKLDDLLTELDNAWVTVHGIEDQKEFAITLKKFNTSLSGILFKMKKEGTIFDDGRLEIEFRNAKDLLIKILKED